MVFILGFNIFDIFEWFDICIFVIIVEVCYYGKFFLFKFYVNNSNLLLEWKVIV